MPYTRRWKWLRDTTGEKTLRGVGRACGVSHSTVQRWLRGGIPTERLTELMVRFNCDPIEACVVWGILLDEHVAQLNYEALVRYAPMEVLTEEVHRRAVEYRTIRPDQERKHVVGVLWSV